MLLSLIILDENKIIDSPLWKLFMQKNKQTNKPRLSSLKKTFSKTQGHIVNIHLYILTKMCKLCNYL